MNDPLLNVLVVEDNPSDAQLAALALTADHGLTLKWVDRLSEALRELATDQYDAVLLDLSLPDSSGLDTLTRLRTCDAEVPVVVMSGLDDERAALQSLDQGAQDYLVKGDELLAVIRRSILNAVQRQKILDENKHLCEALQRAKTSLEERNKRLAEMCETAHEFVDNVSHEFRTPLTVIKEYASILRDKLVGEVNAEQCEYLDIIAARVEDLSHMVDDMLDISKLESGILGLDRTKCDAHEIVDHVVPLLRRSASVKKVVLHTQVEDGLPAVYCDAEKAGRVIINLVINALKFSEEGHSVTLGVRHDYAGAQVVFSISDQGRGIETEELSEIFKRFNCVAHLGQNSTKGFGLGLSIANALVQLNLGDISVVSEPGQGSTFSFTVPTADPMRLIVRYLDRVESFRDGSLYLSLISIVADAASTEAALDGTEQLLQHHLRRSDLILRTEPHTWRIVVATKDPELQGVIRRIEQSRDAANRNRPSGPLPALTIATEGSWRISDQRTEFIRKFEDLSMSLFEPVHA